MIDISTLEEFLGVHPEWIVCPEAIIAPPDEEELLEWYPELEGSELLSRHMEAMNQGVSRGANYAQMRMNGSEHKFAEMISLQKSPGLQTDAIFFSGHRTLYDQFGSQKHLDRFVNTSKAHGFTPNAHAKYFPELARFQGDPEAYVTRSQGRSYIRKLCEQRGWECQGDVKVAKREPESDPLARENCKLLGEDIIRDRAMEMAKTDPSVLKMNRKDLRQKIIDKHGPSK